MTTPLENIFNDLAVGKFIRGLEPRIIAKLRVLEPTSLGQAMDLAQKIQAKIHLLERR